MWPPLLLTALARATSSMTACRIASGIRARSAASALSSTQPPAAAAVREPRTPIRRKGYSWAKKYTKAGTTSFSQTLSARSRAICDTRSNPPVRAAATKERRLSDRCAMSASVSSRNSGPRARASVIPCRTAQSLPVQPHGRLPGRGHGQGQPAEASGQLTGQVTGAVRAAVVDQEDLGPAGVVLGEQRRQAVGQHGGLVTGGDDDTDVRPVVGIPTGRQAHIRAPEEALAQQQPQPGGE